MSKIEAFSVQPKPKEDFSYLFQTPWRYNSTEIIDPKKQKRIKKKAMKKAKKELQKYNQEVKAYAKIQREFFAG